MSDRPLRVSRRRLLQLASLAPLAALIEGGATTAALAQTAQACAKIDDKVMSKLVEKAEKYWKTGPFPVDKFRLVVCVLWTYFLDGAKPVTVDPQNLMRVLISAYGKKGKLKAKSCGELILDNLGSWDDCGNQSQTNVCAYNCGENAVLYAKPPGPGGSPEIDETSFGLGYDDTEDQMSFMMARLRRRFPGMEDKIGTRGFAC